MKIVINIPDRIYKIIQRRALNIVDSEILEKAVREGTPLPNGHGRLIDADATIKEFGEWTDEWDKFAIGCLESADTVIEADKEDEV